MFRLIMIFSFLLMSCYAEKHQNNCCPIIAGNFTMTRDGLMPLNKYLDSVCFGCGHRNYPYTEWELKESKTSNMDSIFHLGKFVFLIERPDTSYKGPYLIY